MCSSEAHFGEGGENDVNAGAVVIKKTGPSFAVTQLPDHDPHWCGMTETASMIWQTNFKMAKDA